MFYKHPFLVFFSEKICTFDEHGSVDKMHHSLVAFTSTMAPCLSIDNDKQRAISLTF